MVKASLYILMPVPCLRPNVVVLLLLPSGTIGLGTPPIGLRNRATQIPQELIFAFAVFKKKMAYIKEVTKVSVEWSISSSNHAYQPQQYKRKKNSKSTPYRMLGECSTNSFFNGSPY